MLKFIIREECCHLHITAKTAFRLGKLTKKIATRALASCCYIPTVLFVDFSLCSVCITHPPRNRAFVRPTKHLGTTIQKEMIGGKKGDGGRQCLWKSVVEM